MVVPHAQVVLVVSHVIMATYTLETNAQQHVRRIPNAVPVHVVLMVIAEHAMWEH